MCVLPNGRWGLVFGLTAKRWVPLEIAPTFTCRPSRVTGTGFKVAEVLKSGGNLKLATPLSKFLRVSREPPSAPTRPALGPMFLRPGRRPARPTSGPSATPVPIPTSRPECPSGRHRDADRRHRHAQRGTSLTQVLFCQSWVKLSTAPSRSSVCLPPSRALCLETHQTRPCPHA